jgi:trehalose 6-phosphate phosphatase
MPGTSAEPGSGSALLARIRDQRHRAGAFLDFDGTLSEIVASPDRATLAPRAAEQLTRLAHEWALVAVVSGRPAVQLRRLVAVPGVEVFGLYGLAEEDATEGVRAAVTAAIEDAERAAREVPGALVERKGASVAIHYRLAGHTGHAERRLTAAAETIGRRHGLKVLPGRMVLELAPPDVPGKGAVVLREVHRRALTGCLFAGDDRADLDAFAALDGLKDQAVTTVKVAIRSEEAPAELLESADLVVDGPAGLIRLLQAL